MALAEQGCPAYCQFRECLVLRAHVIKYVIQDLCSILDDYTTIGPDDQDSNPKIFLLPIIRLIILCDSKEKKKRRNWTIFCFS